MRMGTGRTGAGDEEGHVSCGRELTLQGAGRGWVGVLPSSDLGLVGEREKADVEELGEERFRLRRRMGVLPSVLLPNPTVETITGAQPS